jgi:hypothetical protein
MEGAFALIENEDLLLDTDFAFLRLGDRRYEFGAATGFDNFLRGLSRFIQFPMPCRRRIRRVQYGVIEERIGHWLLLAHFYSATTILPPELEQTISCLL